MDQHVGGVIHLVRLVHWHFDAAMAKAMATITAGFVIQVVAAMADDQNLVAAAKIVRTLDLLLAIESVATGSTARRSGRNWAGIRGGFGDLEAFCFCFCASSIHF